LVTSGALPVLCDKRTLAKKEVNMPYQRTVWASAVMSAMVLLGSAPITMADEVWDWSGYYAGLHAGYGFGDQSVRFSGSPLIELVIANGIVPKKLDTDPSGFISGIQVGANRQEGQFVFGLEVDFSFSDISGSDKVALDSGGVDVTTAAEQELEWFGTARLRAGAAFNRILVYGSGGLAVGRSKFSASIIDPHGSGVDFNNSSSETASGWVAGAGIEFAATESISIKAEYLYYDLGSEKLTFEDETGFIPDDFGTATYDVSGHLVRVGVNFHF